MKSMSLKEFRDGDYDPEKEKLYILKSETEVLYVGISAANIWNRWFGGTFAHMNRNIYGEWFANSAIGNFVIENTPISEDWIFDLLTLEDCAELLKDELDNLHWVNYDINDLEHMMIRKLKPSFNVTYNIS